MKRDAGGQFNSFCHFIEVKFNLAETVYLRTDQLQAPRLVVAIVMSTSGILYQLAEGINNSLHQDFEISRDINLDLIEFEDEFEDDMGEDDEDGNIPR